MEPSSDLYTINKWNAYRHINTYLAILGHLVCKHILNEWYEIIWRKQRSDQQSLYRIQRRVLFHTINKQLQYQNILIRVLTFTFNFQFLHNIFNAYHISFKLQQNTKYMNKQGRVICQSCCLCHKLWNPWSCAGVTPFIYITYFFTISVAVATAIFMVRRKTNDVHNLHIVIYSHTKFHEGSWNTFRFIAGSRFHRTDRRTDRTGRTDRQTERIPIVPIRCFTPVGD